MINNLFRTQQVSKQQADIAASSYQLPLWQKISSGLVSGGVGAFVGNPCDVLLVRMQADSSLPVSERRNYRNLVDGFRRIVSEEGFLTLYNGVTPTVVRAMIVTAAQFASYDQIKESLVRFSETGFQPLRVFKEEAVITHFTSGFLAGFVASVVSNPVDVVKTRIMNMKTVTPVASSSLENLSSIELAKASEPAYTGPIDCVMKTARNEGLLAFYKGFVPTFTRQAPYVVVMFVTMEQLKRLWSYLDSS